MNFFLSERTQTESVKAPKIGQQVQEELKALGDVNQVSKRPRLYNVRT